MEVFECDRGGDVTFHGPGQLVGYPIFDLRGFNSADGKRKTLGAVEYVRRLEEVLIRTCADFKHSDRARGRVYRRVDDPNLARKLTALQPGQKPGRHGHVKPKLQRSAFTFLGAVTSHGFALNVNTDLEYFNLIVPCGIMAKPVTSMAKELAKELSLQEVAHSVSRNFGVVFQSQMLWLESLDAGGATRSEFR